MCSIIEWNKKTQLNAMKFCFVNTLVFLVFFIKETANQEYRSIKLPSENRDFNNFEQQVEIILPIELFGENLLGLPAGSRVFQVLVFGNFYNISVQPQTYFDGVPVQYLSSNNILEQTILENQTCFYSGPSNGNSSLFVVLSYCDGLEGFIKTPLVEFFIQPIKTDVSINLWVPRRHIVYRAKDVNINISDSELMFEEPHYAYHLRTNGSRFRRSGYESFIDFINRSGRRVQLLYFDSYGKELAFMTILVNERRGVNTFHGTKWLVKDEKTNQILLIDGKKSYTAQKGSQRVSLVVTTPTGMLFEDVLEKDGGVLPEYFAEVLVVADQSLTKFHGKKALEKYILTMFNIADIVFKDKSFGIRLNMHLVKIVIIEDQQSSFMIHKKNPSRSLTSACKFVSTLDSPGGNYFKDFDFAIVLTREDFGPSGYARLHSMCVKGSSCALVKDEGLTSAFIIAHEVGHLLSLDHDGEGESAKCGGETARGSLMAPIIVARYDRFHWSTCSREVLKENIEYFQCLIEKPEQKQVFQFNDVLPGKMYTLDDQCQFNFNRQYSLCRSFKFDPCQMLWCSEPDKPSYCKTMRSPALDGSICNEGKHCLKGQCVSDANFSIIYTTVPPVTNGSWGSWESWSQCSRSCGVGIRVRARNCSNPRPGPKGAPCSGNSLENQPCNTEECSITKSFTALRRELCESITENSGWTLYADAPFQKRLQLSRENLNCSFESGFCNWVNNYRNKLFWQTHKGATPSFGTGPEFDHTTKNEKGTYLYMEASSARNESKNEGDTARLVGPIVKVPRLCFAMHYNMFGKDMGHLKVGIIYQNNSEIVFWNKTGNIGKEWQRAEVSIESVDNYRVFIDAVRGIHWSSDIAIDDLAGVSGLCQAEEKARNPCTQTCRSRDGRSFKMNINVLNGLKCTDGRNHDICFNGQCLAFGCDNNFNSTLKVDDCGVCNGNSSSCVKVKGVKELLPKEEYEVIQMLPKGVTFVNIMVNYSRVYYFGLKKPDSIGASLSTNYEDFIVMGGTTFQFIKENGFQKIVSSGPTLEVLLFVVYTAAQNSKDTIRINYEFFQPSDAQSYEYILVGWTACSKTCGIGQQQSIQTCKSSSGITVNISYCEFLKKQVYVKTCYRDPCPERFQWLTHDWSICSKTCGEGFKTRNVSCIKNDRNSYYPNDKCLLPLPSNLEKCNLGVCPPVFSWIADQWSSCTVTCGGGVKTRYVLCTDELTNLTQSDEKCPQPQPETVEPCNEFECDAFIWEVRMEGQCSKTCGRGLKARIVYCVNIRSKNIVPNSYCSGPSPPRVVACNEQMCPEYFWQVHNISLCSATCGFGVVQKEVYCVDKQTNKKVRNEYCSAKKPNGVEECNATPCDKYEWLLNEWSICSKTCGDGFKTRNVSCIKNNHDVYYPNDMCLLPPPLSLEKCNLGVCPSVFSWVAGPWSSCTVTCGDGVKTRNVSCTDELTNLTQSPEKCVQQPQPEAVKPCNEIECDSFGWEVKVEGQCSKSCGGGLKPRIVFCLNIRSKKIVANSYCSGPSPPIVLPCNEHMCPEYYWQVRNISLCSATCGFGVVQKEVYCVDKQANKKVINEYCSAKKPNDVEECSTRPCDKYEWRLHEWSICSKTCGDGFKTRNVSCIKNNYDAYYPNDMCLLPPPLSLEKCNLGVCPSVFSWVADPWSSCTVTCGGGVKTRNVSCTDELTNLTQSPEKCVQQPQPEVIKMCNEIECDSFGWEVKVEGQCSKSCGGGLKPRIVYCVNVISKNIVPNRYCSGPSPPIVLPCNEHMCPEYYWQVRNTSLCSATCGFGVVQKEVYCVDKQTNKKVRNEYCSAKKPNDVEECNATPCDNFVIKYGEWESCSAFCGLGYQKRIYLCTNKGVEVDLYLCDMNITVERSCQISICGAPEDLQCDFDEKNFCNWSNEHNDQFDWVISDKTPFSNASLWGYQGDEKQSGLFALVDFSSMRYSTDKAVLVSPAIQQNGGCFILWYYMTGPNVGYIKVFIKFKYDRKLVFFKEGEQGNEWKRGEIVIESSQDPLKFVIEATVGEIALDEIFFYSEKCQDISLSSPKIEESCKDASPYCTHPERRIYCLDSSVYRTLCCKACAEFL